MKSDLWAFGALASALFFAPVRGLAAPTVFLPTRGTSMLPLIKDGDWIQVEVRPIGEVQAGDVVLFANPRSPTGLIDHVALKPIAGFRDCWITKGINNAGPDCWYLNPRNFRGIVIAVSHDGTHFIPLPRS